MTEVHETRSTRPADDVRPLRPARSGDEAAVLQALADVGPRLARVRVAHGITLDGLARRTGASKSTLSRLETGLRRPSVELLLRIALVYGVTLDELVGLPGYDGFAVPHEGRRYGGDRVRWRLTRSAVDPTPYKLVYAATECEPPAELPTHRGWIWMFVIAGRLRMILDGEETVLGPGDAAEFDAARPHWTGSAGEGVVEVLALMSHDGDARVTTRSA